jgi:hypothetical protein
MKIIMHIGMPKTGSTAIQFSLTRNRQKLISSGVLYPANPAPFSKNSKHTIYLSMLRQGDLAQSLKFSDSEKIITTYGQNFDFYKHWLNDLKNQILDAKPHTLIISEEGFFKALSDKKSNIHKNLQNLLSELNVDYNEFEIIGYLRRPPDYYLSNCQQALKTKPEIASLRTANYIPAVKRISGIYNSRHKLFPFDRTIFPQGDVVRHFTGYAFGAELESTEQFNETISGPAMSILQEYRELFFSESGKSGTPQQVQLLVSMLRDSGKQLGYERPVLREDIATKIWDAMRLDLDWLKEKYGFNFDPPNIPIPDSSFEYLNKWQPKKVLDIIDFSNDEKQKLFLKLIYEMSKKIAEVS